MGGVITSLLLSATQLAAAGLLLAMVAVFVYAAADWADNRPMVAKRWLRWWFVAMAGTHGLLLLDSGVVVAPALTILANVGFYRLMPDFPFIRYDWPALATFGCACAGFIAWVEASPRVMSSAMEMTVRGHFAPAGPSRLARV